MGFFVGSIPAQQTVYVPGSAFPLVSLLLPVAVTRPVFPAPLVVVTRPPCGCHSLPPVVVIRPPVVVTRPLVVVIRSPVVVIRSPRLPQRASGQPQAAPQAPERPHAAPDSPRQRQAAPQRPQRGPREAPDSPRQAQTAADSARQPRPLPTLRGGCKTWNLAHICARIQGPPPPRGYGYAPPPVGCGP